MDGTATSTHILLPLDAAMAIGALIDTVLAISGKVLGVLYFLATPFLSLGFTVLHIACWPLRFLARFETIFIFLSVAVLVGMVSGLVLYSTCTLLVDYIPAFLLGSRSPPSSPKGQQGEPNHSSGEDKRERRQFLNTEDYHKPTLRVSDFNSAWDDRKEYRPSPSTILEEDEFSQGPDDDSTIYSL